MISTNHRPQIWLRYGKSLCCECISEPHLCLESAQGHRLEGSLPAWWDGDGILRSVKSFAHRFQADHFRSFLGRIPILILCFAVIALKLSKDAPEAELRNKKMNGHSSEKKRLDILGIIFLGSTVSSFILLCSAFTEESSLSEMKWELLAALVLSGALFILDEAFWAEDPWIPLKLAVTNGVGVAWAVQVLLQIATFSVSQTKSLSLLALTYLL